MANHGIFVSEQATSVGTPVVAGCGIPFFIGVAPVQSADNPATVNKPVLANNWDEAVEALGYSDDWSNYDLCEAMYSHFKLYGMSPAIFLNVLDVASDKEAVTAADKTVTDHKVELPIEAINDDNLVIKGAGGIGTAYVKGTDYSCFYSGEKLIIELISTSTHYSEASLNVAYNKAKPSLIAAADITTGMEGIELCLTDIGTVPDLIVAPKWGGDSTVAAVMATKASAINGMFKAKALVDIDASAYQTVATAISAKASLGMTDENEIVCWPMVSLGDKKFHMSVQLAGLIATVDSDNESTPYESPSNKSLKCDSIILASGTAFSMSKASADQLNAAGIVTALNFLNGMVAWGNYTGCYPASTDVKDYFIPVNRMFDWVNNTVVKTFWVKLDSPMTRRLIDTIMDTCNIWLNGLVGSGYLLGARAEMLEGENPLTDLMAGKIKVHLYITPPSPAQEIDFVLEYDADYVTAALSE